MIHASILSIITIQSFIFATKSATTTNSAVTCSSYDEILCKYVSGLETIFGATDKLLATTDQTGFESVLNTLKDSSNIIFKYSANSTADSGSILSGSDLVFGNDTRMQQLIDEFGAFICEKTKAGTAIAPNRTTTDGTCYGWLYIDSVDDIRSVTIPTRAEQQVGYAVLMGMIEDFEGNELFYAYPVTIDYSITRCPSDTSECDKANGQQLLGNALFYISLLANQEGFNPTSPIWLDMLGVSYFTYTRPADSYEFYVFVNNYESGYTYIHGEEARVGTVTSLNSDLRKGAASEYGSYVDYTRSSGEQERSYIIAPYPNAAAYRIYVGSGYQIGTFTTTDPTESTQSPTVSTLESSTISPPSSGSISASIIHSSVIVYSVIFYYVCVY